MFCPLCKAEHREGFTRCARCEVALVAALEQASMPVLEGKVVILWRGADPVFLSALVAALRGAEIPFHEYAPVDYENWLSGPRGFGGHYGVPNFDILVLDRDLAAAQEILNALVSKVESPIEANAPREEYEP